MLPWATALRPYGSSEPSSGGFDSGGTSMSSESIPPVVRPSTPPRVTLADVASCAQTSAAAADAATPISGIALSTQSVQPGDLFVALPGKNGHGAQFAARAVQAGAVAVLTDAA